MQSQIIDARGLACPIPVINTKKILDSMSEGSVTTVVDNDAARENVVALARSLCCDVDVQQKGNEYYIQITKKEVNMDTREQPGGSTVIFISSAEMGRGSAELGAILMKSFMFATVESEDIPIGIIFVNSGVQLTCEGSAVLEHLMALEKRGVEILSCGTCLDYFKLKEKLCVGQITNMYTILEKMNRADKVITI